MIKDFLRKIFSFIEENEYSGIAISVGTFLIVVLMSLSTFYEVLELKLYDFRFKLKPSIQEWDRLVFVDMDDNSIISIGTFPWQRRVYATALDVLKQVGATQVTMDIIFPDKSPAQIQNDIYRSIMSGENSKGTVRLKDLKGIIVDNDAIFSEALGRMGKVFIPYNFSNQPPTRDLLDLYRTERFIRGKWRFLELASIPVPRERQNRYKSLEDKGISGISYPIPEIMESAHSFGFVDRDSDPDGTLRRIRLVRYHDGRLYFNLAMKMMIDICGVGKDSIEVRPGDRIVLKDAFNPLTQEKRDIAIPIDDSGMMIVNWAGPGPREKSFRAIPFYGLIDFSVFANIEGGVYDILDEIAGHEGLISLGAINGQIEALKKEYLESQSPPVKREKIEAISALRKKTLDVKSGFLKVYDDQIAQLTKMKNKTGNKELDADIDELRNMKRACEVVLMVESLKDSIVVSGLTATSSHDLTTIPIATDYARVGTYFNTINTILQGQYIHKAGALLNYILMLAISIIIGFIIQRVRARTALTVIAGSFFGLTFIIIVLFAAGNIWIDQMGLTLSLLFPAVLLGSIKFIGEERQKRFIKSAFSLYLAPGVIEQIIENPDILALGGENREITIFFSDIASFSSISERLSPPDLVKLLNEYLSEMTDIILSYNGTIDKYIGDAIMAFYGAPVMLEDPALKACYAAIDMKKRLRELQEEWKNQGKSEVISARMGLNTGMAVVGNMGSRTRMDYTAMGDSVNLASRLEGANKYYGTNAMISESTYAFVKDNVEARKLDVIRVVGKKEPVGIYELLGRKGNLPGRMYDMIELYNRGLDSFNQRDWKKAKSFFRNGLQSVDDDGPSLAYIERCNHFMQTPPPKNWDGVYTMKSK